MKRMVWIAPETNSEVVLACGALELMVRETQAEQITVVCAKKAVELFQHAPFSPDVVGMDFAFAANHPDYFSDMLARVKGDCPIDLCVNMRTRPDATAKAFTLQCGTRTVGHADGGQSGATTMDYTRTAEDCGVKKLEVQRHRDLLAAMDIRVWGVGPRVWVAARDEEVIAYFLGNHGLSPENMLLLFLDTPQSLATFSGFAQAIIPLCIEFKLKVVLAGHTFGSEQGVCLSLQRAGVPFVDLREGVPVSFSGGSVSFVAGLAKYARLTVGAENVHAHTACAVGCRNVVLLGGGDFGRFMPYSELTYAVSLPLHCVGCGWKCKFEKPYCATAVLPASLTVAMRDALTDPPRDCTNFFGTMPKLYLQHADFTLATLTLNGKLTQNDCYLNPRQLAPRLYDVRFLTPPRLPAFGMPPSLCGNPLTRVNVGAAGGGPPGGLNAQGGVA